MPAIAICIALAAVSSLSSVLIAALLILFSSIMYFALAGARSRSLVKFATGAAAVEAEERRHLV
jgi:hypothetical protein